VDFEGRISFIADRRRGDGKRYIVRADQKQTVLSEHHWFDESDRKLCRKMQAFSGFD